MASELNYRPDPAVSAIASQRWSCRSPQCHRIIAFLWWNDPLSLLQRGMFFEAAQKRADELGYRLEAFHVEKYPTADAISRVLYSRGIRGIIVPPVMNLNSIRIMDIDWSKFTAVCCSVDRVSLPLHTVTTDIFATTVSDLTQTLFVGFRLYAPAASFHVGKLCNVLHKWEGGQPA